METKKNILEFNLNYGTIIPLNLIDVIMLEMI
jgi:hypothetical protein